MAWGLVVGAPPIVTSIGCGFKYASGSDWNFCAHATDWIFSEGGLRRHEFKKPLTTENLAEDAEKAFVHLSACIHRFTCDRL